MNDLECGQLPRKRICIIAFSNIAADARVLRQARGLSQEFHVTVCGQGINPFGPEENSQIAWRQLPANRYEFGLLYPAQQAALLIGSVFPRALRWCDGLHSWWKASWRVLKAESFDAVICNDTETILLGIEAKTRRPSTQIVLDLHEYATREVDLATLSLRKKLVIRGLRLPLRRYLLSKLAPRFDAVMTVNEVFAKLYPQEFGMPIPLVVMNAPDISFDLPFQTAAEKEVRLIHHGGLSRYREPERMIKAVGLCPPHVHLYFMFGNQEEDLMDDLKTQAQVSAPGRVHFLPPVKPAEVPAEIARFDAGIYILPPNSFNDEHALPNKFFDFIAAGLALVISPNPCMAKIVRDFKLGEVAEDYTPEAMSKAIMKLKTDRLVTFRQASRQARKVLNAKVEVAKICDLLRKLTLTPADFGAKN